MHLRKECASCGAIGEGVMCFAEPFHSVNTLNVVVLWNIMFFCV